MAAPISERYDSLQKGVIEGGLFPVESLKGWKLAEVVQSTTLDFGAAYTTTFFVVMNKDRWAALEVKAHAKAHRQPNQEYYVNKLDGMSYAAFIHPGNKEDVLDALCRSFGS